MWSQPLERVRRAIRNLLEVDARGELGRMQSLLARQIRVFFLVARWEVYDRLTLHAQALTYDSLLALVPLLAVVLAVVKGFGGMGPIADRMEGMLMSNLAGAPDVQSALSGPIRSFRLNIQDGELGAALATSAALSSTHAMQALGEMGTCRPSPCACRPGCSPGSL